LLEHLAGGAVRKRVDGNQRSFCAPNRSVSVGGKGRPTRGGWLASVQDSTLWLREPAGRVVLCEKKGDSFAQAEKKDGALPRSASPRPRPSRKRRMATAH